GVRLPAQAGGTRRRWTKLRRLRGESGPKSEGPLCTVEERTLPSTGHSTCVYPEGERKASAIRHHHDRRPGGAKGDSVGDQRGFRAGLSGLFVWVPPEPQCARGAASAP